MNTRKYLGHAIALSITVFMAGCTTVPESGTPENGTAVVDHVFPTDIKTVVDYLVHAMLKSYAVADGHPLVAFQEVTDKTGSHLDTKAISNQIRDELVSSGKVRLVADTGHTNTVTSSHDDDNLRPQDNGHPPTHRFRKPRASSYRLVGIIYDAPGKDTHSSATGQYYRMTLSLLDLSTGELIWIAEKENVGHSAKQ